MAGETSQGESSDTPEGEMDVAAQCQAGQAIDQLLQSRSAEAEQAYRELLDKVVETKKIDVFVVSKITLGLLLSLIHQDRESLAVQIWTKDIEDFPLGLGIHGLENGQTSVDDLITYFLVSAHLHSLNSDSEAALLAVDDFMGRVCTHATDSNESELLTLAINNWQVHLREIYNQGLVPDDALRAYRVFALDPPPSPCLRFPRPSPWVVDWNGEDDEVLRFSPRSRPEWMPSRHVETQPTPRKRGFLSRLFGGK